MNQHTCQNKMITFPQIMRIDEIIDEIPGTKTFYLSFEDKGVAEQFKFKSGQFIMLTVFGAGEAAFGLPPSPENDRFHLTIRNVGKLTSALHKLEVGDKVGLRGPFGNCFPFEEIKGKNLIYVTGGIGFIPLRSSIVNVIQHRKDFGRILLLYGARTPKDLMYQYNLKEWEKLDGFESYITVDTPTPDWKGHVGLVTKLIDKGNVPIKDSVAFVCGPPMMFNAVIKELMDRGFDENCIISTLERHMKCGIGKCQHCAIGRTLVCTDGPVYTYKQLKTLGEQI